MPRGLSAYTPLETLLLFQYLSVYGINGSVFGNVSDLLKKDPLVRSASNFEPARLNPDALRDVFLQLLKDEARSEVTNTNGQGSHLQNTDLQSGSRKRKAPSPSLPTIQDALNDSHLIPQLVIKLYARFREHTVGQIKEAERRYQELRREVDALEKGEWDSRLEKELRNGEWDERLRWVIGQRKAQMNGTSALAQDHSTSSPALVAKTETSRHPQPPQHSPGLAPQKARSPQPLRPPVYSSASQQLPLVSPASHRPPPLPPYHANQEANFQPQYAQHTPPVPQASNPPMSGALLSAGMMPPPGVSPSTYPSQNLPPYPYSVGNSQAPLHPPHGPYAPAPNQQQYMPAPGSYYPPYPGQPGYIPQAPPQYPPHRGGRQLSPFQVTPQTPQVQKNAQQAQVAPASIPIRPSADPVTPIQPPTQSGRQSLPAQASTALYDIGRLLNTPSPRPPNTAIKRSIQTPWKRSSLSHRPERATSPMPPSREVSPFSEKAQSPPPPSEPEVKRSTRQGKSRNATGPVPEANGPPARSARASGKRVRGGSTASSAVGSSVRGRTRSQSVLSHASVDNDSVAGRKVKAEPATPAALPDSAHATAENTPSSGQRHLPSLNINKRKRSFRGTSEASDVTANFRRPSPTVRNDMVVVAVRNFPRLSHSIMDSIQSHKHASLFATPVREKQAQGYHEYIKQPQDLKSIRAAIQAGAKAVNAAAAELTPANGIGSTIPRDASTLLLPSSEDLVPPKGIVNSAQLEKEVMRMFANAVMFNPGEDEMVQDAREMADSVAVSLANFRSAERTNNNSTAAGETPAGRSMRRAESEVEDLAEEEPEAPDLGPPATKRKRLA